MVAFLLSVVTTGAVYALLAAGFVVIYRASRILNFAYSDMVCLGGYGAASALAFVDGGLYFPVLIGILLFSFLAGGIIYWVCIKLLAGRASFIAIILTVGLGTILNSYVILQWGGTFQTLHLGWNALYTLPGGTKLSDRDIITWSTTAAVFIGLWGFYTFSKAGKQMRAVAENAVLGSQRGINIHYIFAIAWGLGVCLAALAAIIMGVNYAISLEMGRISLIGFVVAVVGGLDSIKGALLGGLVVSIAELGTATFISPRLTEVVPYMILLLVLIFRPWGLFGNEEEIERV